MLRVRRPIFGSGGGVVLESVFCVSKVIIDLEYKGVFSGDMIDKRCYC